MLMRMFNHREIGTLGDFLGFYLKKGGGDFEAEINCNDSGR